MKEKTLLRIDRDRIAKQLASSVHAETVSPETSALSRKSKTRLKEWSPFPSETAPRDWSGNHTGLTCIQSLTCLEGPVSKVVSDGDSCLCTCGDDGNIFKVTRSSHDRVGSHEHCFASAAAWHRTSGRLVTAGGDGQIKVWNTNDQATSGGQLLPVNHRSCVWSLNTAGDYLVTGSMDHTAKLVDLNVGKCRHTFRSHIDSVNICVFGGPAQPFGIISGSADKSMSLWDIRTANCVSTSLNHLSAINDIAVSCSTLMASCDASGIVLISDLRKSISVTCEKFDVTKSGPANTLCWLTEATLLVASRNGFLRVLTLSASTSEERETVIHSSTGPESEILSLCRFGPNAVVSSDNSGNILLWS